MEPDCTARLRRDIAATTDLDISWDWMPHESLEVSVDGIPWCSVEPAGEDCAWLADHLQDQIVIECLGVAWPRCIAHARHPMVATRQEDVDGWVCPRDSTVRIPIGELTVPRVAEPVVADNLVRWWSDEWGWGVIAHSDGDIWAHFSAVDQPGYVSLAEDQKVACTIVEVRQGSFRRRAERVRVVT